MSEYQLIVDKLLENSEIDFNPKGLFYNVFFKRMDGKIVQFTIEQHHEAYLDCAFEMLKRDLIKMNEEREAK